MDFVTEINGYTLEYYDDTHTYLVEGIEVPSITQILKRKFGNKYTNIPAGVLERASVLGTQTHEAIERYCVEGIEEDLPEVRNFKFLQRQYKFDVVKNEVPVILFIDNEPVSAGRLDLVLRMNGEIGLGDIKRTSVLDKEYLAYQLNMYRVAYRQCYDVDCTFLRGLHLREDVRKYVTIPIKEDAVIQYVREVISE